MTAFASRVRWISHAILFFVLFGCANKALQEEVLAQATYSEAQFQYQLDREVTKVQFAVGETRGRFRVVDARLGFASTDIKSAVLEVTIATASLDLFNPLIEGILKGPEWFAVKDHPQASFRTEQVEIQADHSMKVDGQLTVKSMMRPLRLEVQFPEMSAAPSLRPPPERIAFTASGQFLRSEFGMDGLQSFAPDEVSLMIEGALVLAGR